VCTGSRVLGSSAITSCERRGGAALDAAKERDVLMRTRSTPIVAGLTAALLLGLAVSSATAGRLSTSNTKFRVTWNSLVFLPDEESTLLRMTCRLTLDGSFHSATFRKVPGAVIGAVTRGIVESSHCAGLSAPNRATILQETLPWPLTYEAFSGTLPDIDGLLFLLRRYAFQFSGTAAGLPFLCLYADGGAPEENQQLFIFRNTATGALTEAWVIGVDRIRFVRGSELCPEYETYAGIGEVFLLTNTSRISITLI
jgi:hypothetical protein